MPEDRYDLHLLTGQILRDFELGPNLQITFSENLQCMDSFAFSRMRKQVADEKIFLYSFDPGLSIGEGIMFSALKAIFC